MAGAGAAEAGTGVVGFGVDGEVAPLARLVCCPLAEKAPDSLGRLRGRGEPSIKGVPNLPDLEAGLLAKAEKSLAVSCMSWSWWSSCRTSLSSVLSSGFSGGESWGSSSENMLRRELMMALTLSKECLCLFLGQW